MKRLILVAVATLAAICGSAANASTIFGYGDPGSNPALAGGIQIDFSAFTPGSYGSVTQGGASVAGVGGTINIDSWYAGSYNTTGQYLHNNSGNTTGLSFLFSDPVSAFAFNLGAHDYSWTLAAYAGATLLESFTFGPIQSSNADEYYGLSASGITHATLTFNEGSFDYILLDNLTYVISAGVVPEPAVWAMMLFGFGAVGSAMRRRNSQCNLVRQFA